MPPILECTVADPSLISIIRCLSQSSYCKHWHDCQHYFRSQPMGVNLSHRCIFLTTSHPAMKATPIASLSSQRWGTTETAAGMSRSPLSSTCKLPSGCYTYIMHRIEFRVSGPFFFFCLFEIVVICKATGPLRSLRWRRYQFHASKEFDITSQLLP